jgi:hypothetical protein
VASVAKMLRRMEEGRIGIVGFTCTSYAAQRDRVISGLDRKAFQALFFLLLYFGGVFGMFSTTCVAFVRSLSPARARVHACIFTFLPEMGTGAGAGKGGANR